MASIRTIKPEFWTSEQVMDCGPVTRLLFIGLWNFVDDFGRAPIAPRTIKAQVMPADNFTGDDIQAMLEELRSIGLIRFYSVEGKEFFEITGWAKHQKIDNPSKYKVCPAPPSDQPKALAIPSEELPKIALEGKGGEKEPKGKESIPTPAKPQARASEDFKRFKAAFPRRDGANPWQPAEKKFNALVKTGVDPEVMISAAAALAREEGARGNIGSKFIPQAITWLNQQRFHDYAAAAFSDAPEGLNWDAVLTSYKKFGHWSREAGPHLDSPACRVPKEMLEKYGLERRLDS